MIAIKIEEMLAKRGRSKYWLIKHADITYPMLNKMIDGTAVLVSLPVLERICRSLDCSPAELFELVDSPAPGEGCP